ncbi:MAG: phage tail protein [Acidobacteria bacterium]|nr:phage tail protein [Acidobacteriota bacterium]
MAQFTVNPERLDPYKQFKFRVKWDAKVIAGIYSVSGLIKKTGVIEHREGSSPSVTRKLPGQTVYEPIILVRGRTHDTEFEDWADKVWRHGAALGSEVSLRNFRKDIVIELLNEAGQLVMAFKVYRCWPSEYAALGPMDANDSCVARESLTLQHEGWERDKDIPEPTEHTS